ncbi:MAG: type III polyketide synthase [Thermoguttaceae bacterium]|jgi:predicted naringenin-chalcone synthase
MSVAVLGLATALPPESIAQELVAESAARFLFDDPRQGKTVKALFRRAQVRRRGCMLLSDPDCYGLPESFYPPATSSTDRGPTTAKRMQRYQRHAGPLAFTAAQRALAAAQLAPDQITHLVTVSCTGFFAPGIDVALVTQLGLRPTIGRINVGFMGCHGAINGMRVVKAFVEADPTARPLLCAVELCSLHFQYGWNPDWIVANSLFADGAAALVAGTVNGDPSGAWRLAAAGSCLMPNEEALIWRIGDHGFEMSLSAQVPDLIAKHLRPWMETWLQEQGLKLDEIGSWAVHPGGPRILTSVSDALGLPAHATEVSSTILAEHGNMSSPTVLFILDQLQKRQAPRPCVALAFGPGLMAEAALFT